MPGGGPEYRAWFGRSAMGKQCPFSHILQMDAVWALGMGELLGRPNPALGSSIVAGLSILSRATVHLLSLQEKLKDKTRETASKPS
jgi:hypothetical protein